MPKTNLEEKQAFCSAEELINEINNRTIFNNIDEEKDLLIIEDFDLVQNKMDKREVHSKMMNMMRNIESSNIRPNPNHRIDTSNLPDTYMDNDGDEKRFADIEPEQPVKNQLPAIVTKELMASGINNIKWTDTRDLPRGLDKDIRKLASAVFSAFNIDKNANVMTISSFKDNDFLNTPLELNSVLGFLDKNASSPHEGILKQDFGNTITGYIPEIKLYHTPTKAYLVVREPEGMGIEGEYIYAFKRKLDLKLENKKRKRISNNPS